MTPIVRFAPSPTGLIHIGNLRTALFNWLFAKKAGGSFVLRFDDTDIARSRSEYADAILADLRWIGIEPDRIERQSQRIAHYEGTAERLKAKGLLYPCFETQDELERKRKRLMARGRPPVYGREALRLSEEERQAFEKEGRRPYWRFLLPNHKGVPFEPVRTTVEWDDLVRGRQSVDLASLSDPVLVREDGSFLYTLPSIVDDGDFGITHVIRGDDHVTNTAVQIAIFEALGLTPPAFGHHNLLTTMGGEGLSKRSGALSLSQLRADGYEPMAVASLAVLVGLSGSIEVAKGLPELGQRLDLGAVSQSASKFDPAELDRLNEEIVHALPYEAVAGRLAAMGVPEAVAEPFWHAVRANCAKVGDAAEWAAIVFQGPQGHPELSDEDVAFLRSAFDLLPDEPWDAGTWKEWTDRIKAATDRKGKALFMPLRQVLTGLDHGPELKGLLPVIGHERALARRP